MSRNPRATGGADESRHIFLSYGRADGLTLAERLSEDLTRHGFGPWQDRREIRTGRAWDNEVADAIRRADLVLAILTPHAVRRAASSTDNRDSVCLDEIAFARGACGIPVLPVLAISCEAPFLLYRYQHIDFRGAWPERDSTVYTVRFSDLLRAIEGALASGHVAERDWDGSQIPAPEDFTAFILDRARDFTGRAWLLKELEAWYRTSGSGHAILVTGEPGIGKSAFVAHLVQASPDVLAYYCCRADTGHTLRPSTFIRSLAGMLAARVEGYVDVLRHRRLLDAFVDRQLDEEPGRAFERLLLSPLLELPFPESEARLLVVDALDESLAYRDGSTIVEMLESRLDLLPPWLRLVATSRPDPAVLERLGGLGRRRLDAHDSHNQDDLSKYVQSRVTSMGPLHQLPAGRKDEIATELARASAGNFLFARTALDALRDGLLTVDDLVLSTDSAVSRGLVPGSLRSLYGAFFRRAFGDSGAGYDRGRYLLTLLLAAREPLDRTTLLELSGLSARDLMRTLDQLAAFVPVRDGRYVFFHKSLPDWLSMADADGRPLAGEWAVEQSEGELTIADWCWRASRGAGPSTPRYILQFAGDHLSSVKRRDDLRRLLLDIGWIRTTAQIVGIAPLLRDAASFGDDDSAIRTLRIVLASAAPLLRPTAAGLVAQLLARLPEGFDNEITALRNALAVQTDDMLIPLHPTMTSYGLVGVVDLPRRSDAWCVSHGDRIVAASVQLESGGIEVWQRELPSGEFVRRTSVETTIHAANPLALSADGRSLLVGSHVVDAESGRQIAKLQETDDFIMHGAKIWFSEDGKTVSAVLMSSDNHDHVIARWDARTGAVRDRRPFPATDLAFWELHTDDEWLTGLITKEDWTALQVRTLDDQSVVYETASRPALPALDRFTASSSGRYAIGQLSADASEDGSVPASAVPRRPGKKRAPLSAAAKTKFVIREPGKVPRITSLAPDLAGEWRPAGGGPLLLVRSHETGAVGVWDLTAVGTLPTWSRHERWVRAIAISSDGAWAASVSLDPMLRIWDLNTGLQVDAVDISKGSGGSIGAVAITGPGRHVLTGDRGHQIRDLDLATHRLRSWQSESGCVNALAVARNGRWAAVAGHTASGIVTLRTKVFSAFPDSHGYVVALAPDESVALIGSGELSDTDNEFPEHGAIRAWDVNTRQPAYELRGHRGPVTGLVTAQSSDGPRALSGSADKDVILWDLESRACLAVLRGHTGRVRGVAMSEDAGLGVSAGSDNTLRLWDLRLGQERGCFRGDAAFTACAIVRDGRHIVAGDALGQVHVFRVAAARDS
jgi:WD40 repeat protein